MKLSTMNKNELPREKCKLYGIEVLSNRELIALLLRSGTRNKNVLELSDEVLNLGDCLGEISNKTMQEFMHIEGIKEAKAIELCAAFELGKRIAFDKVLSKPTISCPDDVIEWLKLKIGYCLQENFLVLFLNQANQVITYKIMFVGTLTCSSVHPREIFKEAINLSCAKIMVVHNHPSGNPTPSNADKEITQKLVDSSKLVCIPLLDHIIVAKDSYYSFRENFAIVE